MTEDDKTRPTRDRVAAEAGVSSATVSRVYNAPESVSPEKRRAVLRAAEKIGYSPNKSASALRRNGTGTITLIELKKDQRKYYWADLSLFKWFYADVIHAVGGVIDRSMFQLSLARISSEADVRRLKGTTDGLICFDVDREHEAEMIESSGIPYVIGHHTKDFRGRLRCSTDNFEGGRLQAGLLKDAGCTSPAYIAANTTDVKPDRERLEGFLTVFGDRNVRVIESSVGREPGFRAAAELTKDIKRGRIDGIAAVNDITAAGAGYALEAAGIAAQKDIPLTGYDNMPFGALLPFSLLTVDLKPQDIYRTAAELLLQSLSASHPPKSVTISPEAVNPLTI